MPGNRRHFDHDEAYAMIKAGKPLPEIKRHFGITHVAIINAMKRAGRPTSAKAYKAAVAAGTLPAELIAP